jgi:hypothetical protein
VIIFCPAILNLAAGRATNDQLTIFVRGDIMRTLRILALALLPILAMTAETAPAGSETRGCGIHAVDPGLRAAFERFDRHQSLTAARICALYLNSRR